MNTKEQALTKINKNIRTSSEKRTPLDFFIAPALQNQK